MNNTNTADAFGLIMLGAGLVLVGVVAGWLLRQPQPVAMQSQDSVRTAADQFVEMEHALAMAPFDDEEETPEEAEAVAASRAERDRGEIIPWSQVRVDARLQA